MNQYKLNLYSNNGLVCRFESIESWKIYEYIHIFFWLLKDYSWCSQDKLFWLLGAIPTILISIDLIITTLKNKKLFVDFVHYTTQYIWIISNIVWSFSELYLNDGKYSSDLSNSNINGRYISCWILIFSWIPIIILYFIWLPINIYKNIGLSEINNYSCTEIIIYPLDDNINLYKNEIIANCTSENNNNPLHENGIDIRCVNDYNKLNENNIINKKNNFFPKTIYPTMYDNIKKNSTGDELNTMTNINFIKYEDIKKYEKTYSQKSKYSNELTNSSENLTNNNENKIIFDTNINNLISELVIDNNEFITNDTTDYNKYSIDNDYNFKVKKDNTSETKSVDSK